MTNFIIDEYGSIFYDETYALEFLYQDFDLSNFNFQDHVINTYNKTLEKVGMDKELNNIIPNEEVMTFHKERQEEWIIPQEYKEIDLHDHLLNLVSTEKEKDRVLYELNLYDYYEMNNTLKALIYIKDIMKRHNIIFGIGRGSSVSSYCLYLLGIHSVDSIKYKLDINEFFKNEQPDTKTNINPPYKEAADGKSEKKS